MAHEGVGTSEPWQELAPNLGGFKDEDHTDVALELFIILVVLETFLEITPETIPKITPETRISGPASGVNSGMLAGTLAGCRFQFLN